MARLKTSINKRPRRRVSTPPNTPRLSKAIRQQAEIWTDFFTLALDKLLEESRGEQANRESVRVAGEVANEALAVYEERWPGVYL
jgi:hypothetical protein